MEELRVRDRGAWLRGLDVLERLGSGRVAQDPERALRRWERWRAQPAFADEELLARRLRVDGLDEATLLPLLGESEDDLAGRLTDDPEWLRRIARLYDGPPAAEPIPWPVRSEKEPVGFLHLVEPLARDGIARLRSGIDRLARSHSPRDGFLPFGLADADRIVPLLLGTLGDRLRGFLTRTLVLELQIAKLEERLAGDTPGERFQSFVESLRRPEVALDLLARYPVLARESLRRVDCWVASSLELVERLAADREAIRNRFAGGDDPGELVEVQGAMSDPHRGNRSVHGLRFASGLRLIYKPKPLAVDDAFQHLVRWLGERGLEPALRAIEVLDRGDYGWVEHVEAAPCRDEEGLRRFFTRQGVLLALLYVLEGTDFHFENLIAAGEHPVPVDLEALFHPRVNVPDLGRPDDHPGASFYDSVLRTGLLPDKVWGDEQNAGVDLSALGSNEGQTTRPFWVPVGENTDEMRFEHRAQEMAPVENRPSLAGRPVSVEGHVDDVLEGFRRAYRLLLARREELAGPDGPLARFATADVRVVLRPTRAYGMLLLESFHPQVLGDALERDMLLDRIWAGVGERPFLETIIPWERRDLARGDVPLFTTRPGSRDLWTSDGERLPEVFPETGLDRLRRRLARLSESDLERQAWVARAALMVLSLDRERPLRPSFTLHEGTAEATPDELMRRARAAGDQVITLAFEEADRNRWLAVQPLAPGNWSLMEVPTDTYMGVAGLALFLAHLGEVTGDERYRRAARGALTTLRWMIRDYPGSVNGIGAFNGWGGIVYSLAELGALWADEGLLEEAEALLPRIEAGIVEDESHELLAGAAGGALAALALHRLRPSNAAVATARRCAEHLVDRAVPQERGLGWPVHGLGPRPLAGLAHGAAGIALALLAAWNRTGEERFRRAGLAAIEFERTLYSPERRNWPDLREGAAELADLHGEGEEHFMCAWCQGAPGIALARIAGLPYVDDAEVRQEITTAVATTLAEGFGKNHSLCHGALGNLDFLLQASGALDDSALRERCYRLAAGVLRSIDEDGWLFGLPQGAEPVGLMVGLAGVGHGLLRLAHPERVPSVLTLETSVCESISPGASCSRATSGRAVSGRAPNLDDKGESR